MKYPSIVCLALALFLAPAIAGAECLDSEGEAQIVRGDIPSARNEAFARAKWQAVERAVGVEVKTHTMVQNMLLVDDAVSKKVKGLVKSSRILSEERRPDSYVVKINACVEPSTAQEAVKILARNNSLAVLIPFRKPRGASGGEANILSETIISKLADQGYTVTDAFKSSGVEAAAIERALKSGAFSALNGISARYLSRLMLIGKLDYTVSTRKGEDIGYGISMPFNHVTVRLTYRLLARNDADRLVILDAGTREAKGLAGSLDDAVANGLQEMADEFAPVIIDKVSKHVNSLAEKVRIRVEGVKSVAANMEVKELLQQTTWVTNVEERGLGDFDVSYPENSVYLANSLEQKEEFAIVQFSPESLTIRYKGGK